MTSPPPPGPGEAGAQAPPTCYRHPDRETYVRCVRCDRSICGDCQRPAAVGFQCPDDVAAGQRGQRRPRTVFGGELVGDGTRVTTVLIVANVLIYLGQLVLGPTVAQDFGMQPLFIADGEVYRLLTTAFLHGSPLHLMFNMLALLVLGGQLEAALGRLRYAGLYAVSALGGSVASYLFSDPFILGVGASGAIYGLFGGLLVVARRLGAETGGLVALLAINLVLSFTIPIIDWRAHLGGLVTGAVIAAALAYAPAGPNRSRVQGLALAGVTLVLIALAALRTSSLLG